MTYRYTTRNRHVPAEYPPIRLIRVTEAATSNRVVERVELKLDLRLDRCGDAVGREVEAILSRRDELHGLAERSGYQNKQTEEETRHLGYCAMECLVNVGDGAPKSSRP